jgi:hypothetical protein
MPTCNYKCSGVSGSAGPKVPFSHELNMKGVFIFPDIDILSPSHRESISRGLELRDVRHSYVY